MKAKQLLRPALLCCVVYPVVLVVLAVPLGCSPGDEGSDASDGTRAPVKQGSAGETSELGMIPELAATLENMDMPIANREGAAMAIGSFGLQEGVAPLVRAFGDPAPEVVVAAVTFLPDTDDAAALEALRALLSHPDTRVRAAAKVRLERMK